MRRVLLLVLVGVVLAGWRHGDFDTALVHVGLNAQPCATNVYGATFCGDALRDYRRTFPPPAPVVVPAPAPDPDCVYPSGESTGLC